MNTSKVTKIVNSIQKDLKRIAQQVVHQYVETQESWNQITQQCLLGHPLWNKLPRYAQCEVLTYRSAMSEQMTESWFWTGVLDGTRKTEAFPEDKTIMHNRASEFTDFGFSWGYKIIEPQSISIVFVPVMEDVRAADIQNGILTKETIEKILTPAKYEAQIKLLKCVNKYEFYEMNP